jgi:hypothetical protein
VEHDDKNLSDVLLSTFHPEMQKKEINHTNIRLGISGFLDFSSF